MMEQKAVTGNVRYSEDKPISCEYCYYWCGKHFGCALKQCYYLVEEPPQEKESLCSSCSYGKNSPCIGYCLKEIMRDMKVGKHAD